MPVVRECSYPDCVTLTMGELCLEHEPADEADGLEDEILALSAPNLRVGEVLQTS